MKQPFDSAHIFCGSGIWIGHSGNGLSAPLLCLEPQLGRLEDKLWLSGWILQRLVLTWAGMTPSWGVLTRASHPRYPGRLAFLTAWQPQSSQTSHGMAQGSACKWSCCASYDLSSIVCTVSLPPTICWNSHSLLGFTERGHRGHLSVGRVSRSYCRWVCGMGDIVVAMFGKYNLLLMMWGIR